MCIPVDDCINELILERIGLIQYVPQQRRSMIVNIFFQPGVGFFLGKNSGAKSAKEKEEAKTLDMHNNNTVKIIYSL